jgi:hypothetical protein
VLLAGSGALAGCGRGDDTRSTAENTGPSASSSSSATGSDSTGDTTGGGPSDAGSDTSTAPSAAGSASTAGQLVGKGYRLALPAGWQDATAQFQEYSPLIDAGALNADQVGDAFSDNVNVLREADQAELPPSQAERQFAQELGTVASKVRVEDRTEIDGVRAIHLTGRTKAGQVLALTDQYVCFVGGASYVVTFSFGCTTPAARRTEEVDSMLASWSWG